MNLCHVLWFSSLLLLDTSRCFMTPTNVRWYLILMSKTAIPDLLNCVHLFVDRMDTDWAELNFDSQRGQTKKKCKIFIKPSVYHIPDFIPHSSNKF